MASDRRIETWPREERAARVAAAVAGAEDAVERAGAAGAAEANPGTEQTRQLCQEISGQSGGVCFLGFSRGKDSLAAWLMLRRYFSRVVPFHVAAVPGLGIVERSLAYYEQAFGTPIIRCWDGEVSWAIDGLVYQPAEDEATIDDIGFWGYSRHEIVVILRESLNLPHAWCAFGISGTDSLDRRIWVKKTGGKNNRHRTFYPCFDWTKSMVLAAIDGAGLKLPEDYLLANRSMSGLPGIRSLWNLAQRFPDDMAKIEELFPCIRARIVREEWRRERNESR